MDDIDRVLPMWSINESIGDLAYGPLSGRVDIAQPAVGLLASALTANQVGHGLLGVTRSPESVRASEMNVRGAIAEWPVPIAETYVRGSDLIATYQPVETWPYAPQVYWRAASLDAIDGVQASLSVIVSVQTQLLDTHPQFTVTSRLASSEMLSLAIGESGDAEIGPVETDQWLAPRGTTYCLIRRLNNSNLSLLEFASSSDYLGVRSSSVANSQLSEWRLFAEFLEKGVIRRARVNCALVPREGDIELAVECSRALEHLPLPLTT